MVAITVVGSFVVGITIRVPRPPVLGEGLIGDLFDLGPGGKGTNQALAAARLGADVSLIACVGDDLFAPVATQLYEFEGVSFEHIHRIEGVNTAVGMVTLLPSGENSIVGHLGANMHMKPSFVDAADDRIASSDIVLTQFEVPLEAATRAMERGREHGALTMLNPAPSQPIADVDQLANVDLMTPNETEARILLGLQPDDPTPTPDLARRLLDLGVREVVVTLGANGALVATETSTITHIPAPTVNALDVTGAGDSFNAALAVGLGEGQELRDAVETACYAGAYCATHLGVVDGLPTRDQLDSYRESAD